MSLLTFRNAFLSKVSSRLNAVDVANAKDTDLLIYGALFKHLDTVNKTDIITLDGLRFIETLSVAELDEYAADPSSRQQIANLFKDGQTLQIMAQNPALLNTVASSTQWMTVLDSSTVGTTTLSASPAAMTILAASAANRAKIGPNFLAAIKANSMAYAKLLAGSANLAPADYASLEDLKTNALLAKLIETPASYALIGSTGLAFDTFKTNNVFCGKLLAAALNLTITNFADMAAFAANTAAVNALIANSGVFAILLSMPGAIATLMGNYTARGLLWASESARISMLQDTTVRSQLQTFTTVFYANSGNSSAAVNKKVWLLSIINATGTTTANVSLPIAIVGVDFNNSTLTVLASSIGNAAAPYLPDPSKSKAVGLTVSNSTGAQMQFNFIQMEA